VDQLAARRPRLVAGLRLVRLVGSGGEGEVWEVRDDRGRRRALKLVRPDALADDAEDRSRYLLRIEHPALVRVHRAGRLETGDLDGWGFVEMAYVDGGSLHAAPADRDMLDRLWPLAEALDLLHTGAWSDGLPLVHRDVKPANLVLAPDGELVLVDPSTLRGVDATQLTRVGTPVFSAPEVVTGRIGPPADVYSFAATVVALVTGARGQRLAALLDDGASLDLPAGVRYALSSYPGDRPPSCRAVLEAGLEADPTMLLPALRRDSQTYRYPDGWDGGDEAAEAGWDGGDEALEAGWDGPEPTRRLDPQPSRIDRRALWAPPAEQMRDRTQDRASDQPPDPPQRRGSLWLWTLLLVALVGAPLAAVHRGWLGGADLPTVAAALIGIHLLANVVARRPLWPAIVMPPLAWSFLLAERVGGSDRRRAWARAVFTGAVAVLTALLVPVVIHAAEGRLRLDRTAVVGVALLVVSALTVTAGGGLGIVLRVLLLPLWALGAALLICLGLLAAMFTGSLRLTWLTLTSFVEIARQPQRAERARHTSGSEAVSP
jgi:hypothetical protein